MNVEPPQKGFKTFVILVIILGTTFFSTTLARQTIRTRLSAETTQSPENLKISNITHNSATISWLTNAQTLGFIVYGQTSSLNSKEGENKTSNIHHITLTNLTENTLYYFEVGVGDKTYNQDGKPYTFTTAASTSEGLSHKVFGQILNIELAPAENVLVYLNIKDKDGHGSTGISTTLSSVTNPVGLFTLDLAKAKVADLSEPFDFSKRGDLVEIIARGPHKERSSILLDVSQTQPTPTITLSLKGRLIDLTGQEPSQGKDIILPSAPPKSEGTEENLIRKIISKILGL